MAGNKTTIKLRLRVKPRLSPAPAPTPPAKPSRSPLPPSKRSLKAVVFGLFGFVALAVLAMLLNANAGPADTVPESRPVQYAQKEVKQALPEAGTVPTINYGQVVAISIPTNAPPLYFQFAGNAGDVITARAGVEGWPFFPGADIKIFDPNGLEIYKGMGNSIYIGGSVMDLLKDFKLRFSGTYTIVAHGCCENTSGYKLELLAQAIPTPVPPTGTTRPPTPTPYALREYPQRQQDGSVVLVRQWSDGRYETLREIEPPYTPTPTAVPPTPTPSGPVRIAPQNVNQLALLSTLTAASLVDSLAFSPDSSILASGSRDTTIRLWRVSNWTQMRAIAGPGNAGSAELAFSPDGSILASGTGYEVQLLRVADGTLMRTLKGNMGLVRSVTFSPDGLTITTGSNDPKARLWRVSDGRLLRAFDHNGYVASIAFSPDGSILATGEADWITTPGTHSYAVWLWSVENGGLLRVLRGDTGLVTRVVFSPDGSTLASGVWGDTIRLWRVVDGMPLRALGQTRSAFDIAFSPDGQLLASVGSDLKIWEVASGREVLSLSVGGVGEIVSSVAFSPDGVLLAVGVDGVVKVWGLR